MKINAIIQRKGGGTLVLDLPRGTYDLYEKLQSVGITQSPQRITLTDEEGDEVRVKLYADNELGRHLILILSERDSLADADLLAFMVDNAREYIRSALDENILHDRYDSMQAVVEDIKRMTYEAGPVKAVFYCPLVGNIDEGDGNLFTVGNSYLKDYQWAIEEALEKDPVTDERDMANFFRGDETLTAKLVSAQWGVEAYRGRLFGRIECSLKDELTEAEEETLKKWINGQSADGYGEHFEQKAIETEDGDLFVSFWNSGSDYAIMTRDELDEYIENQGMALGGM